MANALYPKFKAAMMKALTPDLSAGGTNVKAALIDLADYTYSAAHEFLSDVASGAIVATSGNLASKTVASADGTFDFADFTFSAVTGDVSEAVIFYIDTGSGATSRLIGFFDTGISGIPVTPNGGDIAVAINASGLFTP